MRKRIALTLLWVGIMPSVLLAHQFYISITTIQHHAESQRLTVRVKLFINDLEESIYQEEQVRLGLWENEPIENAQSYIKRYVSSKLLISINGFPVELKFKNYTVEATDVLEDNVILCHLEANSVAEIRTIKIHNSLLTETIDSQSNIVKIRANGTRKSINLNKRLPEDEVLFR